MRRFLLAVLMLAATSTALAAWVKATEDDDIVHYLDPSTLRRNGNMRQVWIVQDFKKRDAQGVMSRRVLT